MSEVIVHEMKYYGGEVSSDVSLVNYCDDYYEEYRKICCDCFRSLSLATNLDPDEFYTTEDMIKKKDTVYLMFLKEEMIGSVEIHDNIIDHLFVNERYQKRGYGKKLLLFAINYLQQLGVKDIILYVADINKEAVQLYLNNGFKITKTTKEHWGN